MANSTIEINISLEAHLIDSLRPLYPILPPNLVDELTLYITDPLPPLIPYNTLFKISQWARTDKGLNILKSKSLSPQDYSMISLLAGTTSSPERKFGDYFPPKEPEELEADRARERKTITALINSLLSVAAVAFATWWAADKTGWKNEWRVLFALFAAILVAVSEAGLYMIWQSRRSKAAASRVKKRSARHKKVDQVPDIHEPIDAPGGTINSPSEASTLRHRR